MLLQNPPVVPPCLPPVPTGRGTRFREASEMLETTADVCEVKPYPNHWMHTDPGSSTSCDLKGSGSGR